jgi:hypothetical protein
MLRIDGETEDIKKEEKKEEQKEDKKESVRRENKKRLSLLKSPINRREEKKE